MITTRLRALAGLACILAGVIGFSSANGSDATSIIPTERGLEAVGPARLVDSRPGGITIDGLLAGTGPLGAERTIAVRVTGRGGVAADAHAVLLNLTAVDPAGPGYLTAYPCGTERPLASNVNYDGGDTRPNTALVATGDEGKVCIYSSNHTHLVIDVNGQIQGAPAGGLEAVGPARLVDSRPGGITIDGLLAGTGPLGAERTIAVRVTGRGGVAADAHAVLLNLTAVDPAGPGYLTAYPCGTERPLASNVNYDGGDTRPNTALVATGDEGKVCIYSSNHTHLVIDVNGQIQGAPAGGLEAVGPARLVDSRPGGITIDGLLAGTGPLGAERTIAVRVTGRGGVAADAHAVLLNLTAVDPAGPGYLTAYPCGTERPLASNVNYDGGDTRPNTALVATGDEGKVCIYSSNHTHLVIDVTGQALLSVREPMSVSTMPSAPPATTAAPVSTTTTPSPSTPGSWRAWTTSPTDPAARLTQVNPLLQQPSARLAVAPSTVGRIWLGVGAALTDSSIELIAEHADLLARLYAADRPDGAQLNLLRLPMSASDFSTSWWSWMWSDALGRWVPPSEAVRAADIALRIGELQPALSVSAVAWSAPPSMKSGGSLAGGGLLPGYEDDFAALIVDQAEWLTARGVPLDALAIVNEPGYSNAGYPTMTASDEQLAAVGRAVAAAVDDDVELWAVDHNWSDRARVDAVVAMAPGVFDRGAFHCYGGAPEQMAGLSIPAVMTECTGTTDTWQSTFRWDAANLIMRSIESGSTGLILWNLALDTDGGPKLPGGCTICRGLLTIDRSTGRAEPTPEFFALAHLARAADPGAVVGVVQRDAEISAVSFTNPDGTLGVVGFNDASTDRTLRITTPGATITFSIPGYSYFTARQEW